MYMTGTLLPVSNNRHCLTVTTPKNSNQLIFSFHFFLDTIFLVTFYFLDSFFILLHFILINFLYFLILDKSRDTTTTTTTTTTKMKRSAAQTQQVKKVFLLLYFILGFLFQVFFILKIRNYFYQLGAGLAQKTQSSFRVRSICARLILKIISYFEFNSTPTLQSHMVWS